MLKSCEVSVPPEQPIRFHASLPQASTTTNFHIFPLVCFTSWWFQPIWKILVKLDHFPGRDENKKSSGSFSGGGGMNMEDSRKACLFRVFPLQNSSFASASLRNQGKPQKSWRDLQPISQPSFFWDPPGVGLNGDPAERLISVCERGVV